MPQDRQKDFWGNLQSPIDNDTCQCYTVNDKNNCHIDKET